MKSHKGKQLYNQGYNNTNTKKAFNVTPITSA